MEIFWLIIIGCVGGILGGMGMGGGTLLIPLLNIFLNIEQNVAQGINLLAFLPMSIVALIIHSKNKMVDYRHSFWFVITGVCGAVGGALLANIVDPKNLKIYFAIFLILLGIFQFVSMFVHDPNKSNFQKFQKNKN